MRSSPEQAFASAGRFAAGSPELLQVTAAAGKKTRAVGVHGVSTIIGLHRSLVHRVERWRRLGVQLPAYKLHSAQNWSMLSGTHRMTCCASSLTSHMFLTANSAHSRTKVSSATDRTTASERRFRRALRERQTDQRRLDIVALWSTHHLAKNGWPASDLGWSSSGRRAKCRSYLPTRFRAPRLHYRGSDWLAWQSGRGDSPHMVGTADTGPAVQREQFHFTAVTEQERTSCLAVSAVAVFGSLTVARVRGRGPSGAAKHANNATSSLVHLKVASTAHGPRRVKFAG